MRRARVLLALATALALLLIVDRSSAHTIGLSRGDYALRGELVSAELIFARREIASVVALDRDADGDISAEEIASARSALEWALLAPIEVEGDGARCKGSLLQTSGIEEDGLLLRAEFRCPDPPKRATIRVGVLGALALGHRHVAHGESESGATDAILSRDEPRFVLGRAPPGGGFLGMVRLGVEHILTGYDHLAFLFALVLVGGRLRALALVVTAFTVGHSLTLALAVLGVYAPEPRYVEPAIALSIAYVGLENYFVEDGEKRWRIALPFGLVHGFGFAGVLGELALPADRLPAALFAFNLGVEAGQLAVLALVLPLTLYARRERWFKDTGVKALSAAVTIAGMVWFVSRIRG